MLAGLDWIPSSATNAKHKLLRDGETELVRQYCTCAAPRPHPARTPHHPYHVSDPPTPSPTPTPTPKPNAHTKPNARMALLLRRRTKSDSAKAAATAWGHFVRGVVDTVKAEHPGKSSYEIKAITGDRWRGMSENDPIKV